MKGVVEALLAGCLDKWRLISYPTSDGLTDNSLLIEIEGRTAGYCGRLEPGLRQKFGCKQDVFVAELNVDAIRVQAERKYVELPRFPRVKRDIAFFLGSDVEAGDVQVVIREACGELLQAVELFDVYDGRPGSG